MVMVKVELRIVENGAAGTAKAAEMHIQHSGSADAAGADYCVAAPDESFFNAGEIDGGALPGVRRFHIPAMHLKAPHARLNARRGKLHGVAGVDGTLDQGAGDDCAKAVHGEYTVHRQPEGCVDIFFRRAGNKLAQRFAQGGETLAGAGGNAEDRLSLKKAG